MEETKLQVFKNEEFGEVRTLFIKNEPWFVGKDIAEILGYERPTKAVQDRVDVEDKDEVPIQDSIGRMQKTPIINESGLYALIISSKLPKAKEFKRWVTNEVLPSIRKHGMYATPKIAEELFYDPENLLTILKNWKKDRDEKIRLQDKVTKDRPKVLFADSVETSENSILVGQLAKLIKQNGYEIGQNRLFEWMRENGYLIKQKGENYNLPTQYSMDKELMEVKKRSINNPDGSVRTTATTKVTGKGQIYFINKFLKDEA